VYEREILDVAKTKAAKKKDNPILRYFRETRAELRKVRWPSREEAWSLTKIVLAVTISMAIFLGLLDYLFSLQLGGMLEGNAIAVGISVVVVVGGIVAAVILNRQEG
jgi:preprotein translocase subunit SecE